MSANESKGKSLLENAYRLATPEDNISYYRDFSASYDEDFAEALGFALPNEVARVFRARQPDFNGRVADLGCGTGLVAEALQDIGLTIDGLDISEAMLQVAATKGFYDELIQLDLTRSIDEHADTYQAVLSSGTFTHGHLGPEEISKAIQLGQRGCLFVLSVNLEHYQSRGFEAKFRALLADNLINGFVTDEVSIYATSGHEHSTDRALIVSFIKA